MIQKQIKFRKLEDFLKSQLNSHTHLELDMQSYDYEDYCSLFIVPEEFEINEEELQSLCSALANCSNLQNLTLYLGVNWIQDSGVLQLGSALSSCKNLMDLTLCLEGNGIKPQGAKDLGLALTNCPKLQSLTIQLSVDYEDLCISNEIGEFGAFQIGSNLAKCANLQILTLDLNYKEIGCEGTYRLCLALSKCLQLKVLRMYLSYQQARPGDSQSKLRIQQSSSKLNKIKNLVLKQTSF
ncbi:cyclic nucleotide-binding domain protein (macronuclear) [Tetrahymena thermophila SB210]|uniref:Cyclic nucleotide-binding domain protein n=1 Tax=Tetrahymena thermophila (strain SB210) TaxID=312017 RepID=W7X9D9_TETTS|nr:cyclic nucleotide-binding domain protein [Tetrahymena thermophila SB210]EWS73003.1 cyclic nucleotide-binding domain protein [Tetrahymena thermophila SB210]|eukprot:XP_012654471.1 cyclic nucleotide-binding domain protein [Tetrahymena thermophila SB210]